MIAFLMDFFFLVVLGAGFWLHLKLKEARELAAYWRNLCKERSVKAVEETYKLTLASNTIDELRDLAIYGFQTHRVSLEELKTFEKILEKYRGCIIRPVCYEQNVIEQHGAWEGGFKTETEKLLKKKYDNN